MDIGQQWAVIIPVALIMRSSPMLQDPAEQDNKKFMEWCKRNKCDLYDIIHDDNGFVVRGYDAGVRWCTAASPDGTWTDVTVPASSLDSIYFIDYIDGNYLEGGYVTGSTNTARLINAPDTRRTWNISII